MTLKKIFAFTLSLLLLAGSVFAVSAETPPRSWNFDTKEAMLESLDDFIEDYPFIDGYYFNRSIPTGSHLEQREVIIPQLEGEGYVAESYAYAESQNRQGVDYTFTSYSQDNTSNALRFLVYYNLNVEEIQKRLNVEGATKDETQGYINYCAIEPENTEGLTKCEYRIASDDKLICAYSNKLFDETFYEKLLVENTGLYLPVEVKDSDQWFDDVLEKSYVIGDANSDGVLNIRDATAVQKYSAKFSEVDKLVADFNGDLKINIKDATEIQKKLAGLDYTCRRELYPVTFSYHNNTDERIIDSVSYSSGPLSHGELDLIIDGDVPDITNYTTVFNSVEEFKAFFGKTLDKFDEEFFETKALVYLYRYYGSSSQRIAPDSLTYKDGILHVWCGYDEPGDGEGWECMWGNYNVYFEVDKDDIKDLRGIRVSEVMAVYD